MTDARNDEHLLKVIAGLPRGSGIIFRHYHQPPAERYRRFCEVQNAARRRDLLLLLAGPRWLAQKWRADGSHNAPDLPSHGGAMIRSMAVHNAREMHRAHAQRVQMVLLSPVYTTRSHPGQAPLNRLQVRRLAALSKAPVILLGGMTHRRFAGFARGSASGWAAIDGLSG